MGLTVIPTESSFLVIPTERSDEGSLSFVRDDRDKKYCRAKGLPPNTPIIPSEVVESIVISQIPLMVGRISVKSEDLFEPSELS
jgi:hypothetical protein